MLAEPLQGRSIDGAGLLPVLGIGVLILVFLALRATFAAVAVLLEPVFALVRLLLKLVLVFAVVVALAVLFGLGRLGGRGGDVGTAVPTGTPIGTPPNTSPATPPPLGTLVAAPPTK